MIANATLLPDKTVLTCNVTTGDGAVRAGSKAYVIHVGSSRIRILVKSRGGRWISRWAWIKNLSNFRMKTVPPERSIYDRVPDFSGYDFQALTGQG